MATLDSCATCSGRGLVGGFLPASCPSCNGGVDVAALQAEVRRLRAALPTAEEREALELLRSIANLHVCDSFGHEPEDIAPWVRARDLCDRLLAAIVTHDDKAVRS